MNVLKNDWNHLLLDEFNKEYYKKLEEFLAAQYSTKTIYPRKGDIFNALNYTSYSDTKVVIIGQDPYHGPDEAHGLCFSVNYGIKVPPSLRNIYKELKTDLNCYIPNTGCLTTWSKQGILMLNTILTVEENKPNSHKGKGWEIFTDKIISLLNQKSQPVIFILWGNNAKSKKSIINNSIHYILESPHPSPLSAYNGFFGCKHFSKVNEILEMNNKQPINWQIEDQ